MPKLLMVSTLYSLLMEEGNELLLSELFGGGCWWGKGETFLYPGPPFLSPFSGFPITCDNWLAELLV